MFKGCGVVTSFQIKMMKRKTLQIAPPPWYMPVITDDKWHDWDFGALTKELLRWRDHYPVSPDRKAYPKKGQLLHVSQRDSKTKVCVYGSSKGRKSCEFVNVIK